MCSRVFPDSCCSSHFVRTNSNSWHEGAKATGNPSWDQTVPVKELTSLPLFKPGAAAFRGSSRPLAPQLCVWKPPLIVSSDIYSHSAISGSAETITGAFCQTWQPESLRLTSPCHSDSMMEPNCLNTNKEVPQINDTGPQEVLSYVLVTVEGNGNQLKQRIKDWAEETTTTFFGLSYIPFQCLNALHLFLLLFEHCHWSNSGFLEIFQIKSTSFPFLLTFFSAQRGYTVNQWNAINHEMLYISYKLSYVLFWYDFMMMCLFLFTLTVQTFPWLLYTLKVP